MRAMFTSLHTRFPVHCVFEHRPGLSARTAHASVEEMHKALDWSTYTQPLMRYYYPLIDVHVGDKREPGLQVVDMLLCSLGQ
jgi:hypothetical protein